MSQSYISAYLLDRTISNSKDFILELQNNIEELIFDYSKEVTYRQASNTMVVYVYDDGFKDKDIAFVGFDSFKIPLFSIANIEGRVGGYKITIDSDGGEKLVKYSSYLVFGGEINRLLSFDAILYTSKDEVLRTLTARAAKTDITKSLLLNSSLCDYHGCDTKYCTACLEVCKSSALIEDKINKKIHLSFADCIKCGSCIGVCPSGAMESSKYNFASFVAVAQALTGYSVLISTEADLVEYKGELHGDTLIFPVENYSFLNELYLSVLAFKTGGEIYFTSRELPESVFGAICNVNDMFKTFGYDSVVGYMEDGTKSHKKFQPLEKRFENSTLRRAVSSGFEVLGLFTGKKTESKTLQFYDISVDTSCTVCMGCAFVCKSGAFYADEVKGALSANPSLCNGCNHCVLTCPEKSIKLEQNIFKSEERFFSFNVMAKDELFYCVECGKPFATQKSISKVASVFDVLFADETKRRTLYCCADCKPKLMLADYAKTKGVEVGK